MMGLFTKGRPRGPSSADDKVPEDTNPDDTSILSVPTTPSSLSIYMSTTVLTITPYRDEDEGSIILSLISQLRWAPFVYARPRATSDDQSFRVGMDLHKVTFPTFVLEPRSMLERITDFMAHPDLIFG